MRVFLASCFEATTLSVARQLRYAPDMVDDALLSRVKTLSATDRLELIGAVWETFSLVEIPLTETEKALLDSRLADLEKNPDDQSAWAEVQIRLRQQLP